MHYQSIIVVGSSYIQTYRHAECNTEPTPLVVVVVVAAAAPAPACACNAT